MALSKVEKLYSEFLADFPNFKTMVRKYEKNGKDSILITTNLGKKIVYKKTTDGTELSPA